MIRVVFPSIGGTFCTGLLSSRRSCLHARRCLAQSSRPCYSTTNRHARTPPSLPPTHMCCRLHGGFRHAQRAYVWQRLAHRAHPWPVGWLGPHPLLLHLHRRLPRWACILAGLRACRATQCGHVEQVTPAPSPPRSLATCFFPPLQAGMPAPAALPEAALASAAASSASIEHNSQRASNIAPPPSARHFKKYHNWRPIA